MSREIISLQTGHYANHVAAHWWNVQRSFLASENESDEKDVHANELDHGCFFREVISSQRRDCSYAPRAIAVDLKGAVRSTADCSESADAENIVPDDKLQVFKSPLHAKNLYQEEIQKQHKQSGTLDFVKVPIRDYKLEKDVKVWSDFLAAPYHEKSVCLLGNYHINAEGTDCFKKFHLGCQEFKNDKFFDDYENSLHFFAEEADSLQGFQILSDVSDGFGGLSVEMVNHLRDEFGRKQILCYATWEGFSEVQNFNEKQSELVNIFYSISQLSSSCDMLVPLSVCESFGLKDQVRSRKFKYLDYESSNKYSSSAILAMAIDLSSLAYSQVRPKRLLSDICQSLNSYGHVIGATDIVVPWQCSWSAMEDIPLQCLFPSMPCTKRDKVFTQFNSYRGMNDFTLEVLPKRMKSSSAQHSVLACDIFGMDELQCNKVQSSQSLLTWPPFPQIFSSDIDESGKLMQFGSRSQGTIVRSLPCATSVTTSGDMHRPLSILLDNALSVVSQKRYDSGEFGFTSEELNDSANQFATLVSGYQ